MTTGTKIVQKALSHLSVHSVVQPASSESISDGADTLNSLIAMWQDEWNIDMGCVPLEVPGDDLSEPLGARNDLQYCLAVQLSVDYPGAQVSPMLRALAEKGFQNIVRTWGVLDIPKMVPRNTLPKGQGNKRGGKTRWDYTFFPKDSELG